MTRIVLSHTGDDSEGPAGRLSDRLQAHFGVGGEIINANDLPADVDLRVIDQADVLLAVIADGPSGWDHPDDFGRVVLERALTKNIPVIPVLVGAKPMPREEELPPSLRALANRPAWNLEPGADFQDRADRLISGLGQIGLPMTAGHSFVVEVVSGAKQGAAYELAKDRVLIGRSPECDISLAVTAMSRSHAHFVRTGDGYSFEDLGSANGSFVNGHRVGEPLLLRDGDLIHTGSVILVYRMVPGN